MTTYIEFECGGGVILTNGSVTEAIAHHTAWCRDCPDPRTPEEKYLDSKHRSEWEARVDAALASVKKEAS